MDDEEQSSPVQIFFMDRPRLKYAAGGMQIPEPRIKQEITEALRERGQGKNIIGLCGSDNSVRHSVTTAIRREQELFDKFVTATVTNMPNIRNIQTQIGDAIGFNFDDIQTNLTESTSSMCFGNNKKMTTAQRALILRAKMKELSTVLVVLYDVHGRLDFGEIGIPFDQDHQGCKILLTSTSEEVLSQQMKVHKLIQI